MWSLFCLAVDNRDQHTLEKLRAERQAKIDELKERTNYYTTQQLIQVVTYFCSITCSVSRALSTCSVLFATN